MQAGGVALPWRAGGISSSTALRAGVFLGALAIAGATVGAGTMMVPVRAAALPADERSRYLLLGVAAAVFVAAADGAFLLGVRRWSRRLWSATAVQSAPEALRSQRLLAPLAVLRPELVPARLIVMTAIL
ncbi:MAG TPA: hypothetical protein VN869_07140, partial [Steroidobacteraceae bacterium]|nr:hypothetical protein [Steroidobacteraceae bacterium]